MGTYWTHLGSGVCNSGGYYSMLLPEYHVVTLSSSLFRENL